MFLYIFKLFFSTQEYAPTVGTNCIVQYQQIFCFLNSFGMTYCIEMCNFTYYVIICVARRVSAGVKIKKVICLLFQYIPHIFLYYKNIRL